MFEFFDGMPLPTTVTKSWDTLDLLRAVDVFLNAMPGASMVAMRAGYRSIGANANHKLIYTDPKADSAQVVLTANTVTAYGTSFLDLTDGPLVVEVPGNSASFVDDIWQRYVSDMGNAGEDKGAGGKYLFLPPGYDGDTPEGYYVRRSGPSISMTPSPDHCCRPRTRGRASTACTEPSPPTATATRSSTSHPNVLPTPTTGSRPYPARGGSSFSASTAPSNPGSRRPGDPTRSNTSARTNQGQQAQQARAARTRRAPTGSRLTIRFRWVTRASSGDG